MVAGKGPTDRRRARKAAFLRRSGPPRCGGRSTRSASETDSYCCYGTRATPTGKWPTHLESHPAVSGPCSCVRRPPSRGPSRRDRVHPTESDWREMLDGEVERRRLVVLVEHLAECPDCRRALAELQRAHEETIEHLSRLVTHVPERGVEAVRRRSRGRALRRRVLIAAGVALVATTAAGATIRSGVLHSLVAKLRGAPSARISPPAVRAVPETQESPAPSGIALEPHGTV